MKPVLCPLKAHCLSAVLLFVSLAALHAHEGDDEHHHPVKVEPAEHYRPTAIPDRIILTWTGDPTTTQAVTWRTSVDVRQGLAELAVATAGPEFKKQAKSFKATSQALMTNINTAHFHTVEFVDLQPGTKYCYRVGDGVNWSEWFHFTTAKSEPEPFSFIYFGDAQNDVREMWGKV